MDLELSNKSALVSGSTQGIGKSIAFRLASEGAKVTLLARDENALKQCLATLPGNGHTYLVADFSQPTTISQLDPRQLENVDILINNAGGPPPGELLQATWGEFLSTLDMHLHASHLLTQAVTRGMKERKFGRIINIISTSVRIPIPGLGVSNTIRGAMASWAKTLAWELGPFGITVNSLLPGFFATGRLEAIINDTMKKTGQPREEVISNMVKTVPVRRFGDPEEMAAFAAFLASPLAAYVTGQAIAVDGGRTGSI